MLREARMKPEQAEYYPNLIPGHWYTAAALAGLLKGSRIIIEGPGARITDRILQADHFEFRGGSARRGCWAGMRTRRLDRHTEACLSGSRAAHRWLTSA